MFSNSLFIPLDRGDPGLRHERDQEDCDDNTLSLLDFHPLSSKGAATGIGRMRRDGRGRANRDCIGRMRRRRGGRGGRANRDCMREEEAPSCILNAQMLAILIAGETIGVETRGGMSQLLRPVYSIESLKLVYAPNDRR